MTRIYLAGDSTVQTYDESKAPQAGWGQFISGYFTSDVQFLNHAIGGRSSKSFVVEGRLEPILNEIAENDYLLIQMGHNDSTVSKPERYTEPYTEFKRYLKMYVDGARAKGAIPILITPVATLHVEEGRYINDFPDYCAAMKQLAAEEQVLFLDLMSMSLEAYEAAGYDEAFAYFMASVNETDFTHFTQKGANRIAQLVARGLEGLRLNLPIHSR